MELSIITVYLPVAALFWLLYSWSKKNNESRAKKLLQQAITDKLDQPSSLHPVIDYGLCMGCGACAAACPEHNVLGIINRKAQLLNAANCIGHGACKEACPFDAIKLVFGTLERGVDIPLISADFETSRTGVFIAGELGGMGLIRNAINQGSQAVDAIAARMQKAPSAQRHDNHYDLVIIGAGPSGISASLAAQKHQLKAITIEQESFGGTVSHFPRNKVVMTAPVDIPLAGKIKIKETTKEALLETWDKIIAEFQPNMVFNERLTGIEGEAGDFVIKTNQANYSAKFVLLAMGRRGTPRTLGVTGEELTKVVYRLIDPSQYKGQHVLVVGGGDSALEAATSIADENTLPVAVSYRSDSFSRAKPKNRALVEAYVAKGKIELYLNSSVSHIDPDSVTIQQQEKEITLANHAVIVCAGGILPTPFLKECGINVETKYGAT